MPVIAVGAAMYAGATIATVGIAAMTTFEVIAAVGAIAAGVGAVTGNETLMKVGGLMSVAGGIGSLATAAGTTGAATEALATDAFGESLAAQALPNAAEAAVSGALPSADLDTLGQTDAFGESLSAQTLAADAPAVKAGEAITGTTSGFEPVPAGGMTTTGTATPPNPLTGDYKSPFAGLINGGGVGPSPYAMAAGKTASTGSEILDRILGFAKANDKTMSAFLNVGGNLVAGMFDPKKPAEIEALHARAASDNAATALANQRVANQSAPAPTASGSGKRQTVYGTNNPQVYSPPALNPGLISTPAVTGRV